MKRIPGRIDPQILREAIDYDPLTGGMQWKHRPVEHFVSADSAKRWNKAHAGKTIHGTPDANGYLRVNMRGTPFLAHQLIWALTHGEYAEWIDHRNGNPSDNRLSNLRACTRADNQHNQRTRKTNTSGFKGVSFHKATGRWRASIFLHSKQKHLGMFDDPAAAHAAYRAAADLMHGEFANYGASIRAAT